MDPPRRPCGSPRPSLWKAHKPNHLHIVVQVPPTSSVAEFVQIFKGGTSQKLRKEYPELEDILWGDSFWAEGYFAKTVDEVNEDVVKKYI